MSQSGEPMPRHAGALDGVFDDAFRRIDAELVRKPEKLMRLDVDAGRVLLKLNVEYFGDVGEEAVRLARRAGLTNVDESHIAQAAVWVAAGGSSRSAVPTTCNTLGGLFGGAGLASTYTLLFNTDPHTTAEFIVAIVLTVLGTVLLTTGITLELSRPRRG